MPTPITSPNDPALGELCRLLAVRATDLDRNETWPEEQLRLCADYGVYAWFIGEEFGGQAWSAADIVRGYLALGAACLTTTFVITQLTGACRRIEAGANLALKEKLLPAIARGENHATVGISHLTTSRRHLATPVLRAERTDGGFILDGYSPWVTGGPHADTIVVGATLMENGESTPLQLLAAMPTELDGVSLPEPFHLIGVTGSRTGPVKLDRVRIAEEFVLDGPVENVMQRGRGAGTGGYETSTLAIGLTDAALRYLRDEATKRPDLDVPLDALRAEHVSLEESVLATARGEAVTTNDDLRRRANSLVLRATQAALTAAKGSGYVVGHPAGRWCREALFFLVWSCPQSVLSANLCELAGVE